MKTSQINNKAKNIVALNAILCCLLCFTSSSCVEEVCPYNPTTEFEITLNIQDNLEVLTKATPEQELRIEQGYVLVYNRNKIFRSIYPIDISRIENNGSQNPKITLEGFISNNDIVVLILNPAKENITNSSSTIEYSAIDTVFELGMANLETEINGHPMSGEFIYGTSTTAVITRAFAKIEVHINSKLTGDYAENFTLENVKYDIFQQSTKGRIRKSTTGLNYASTDDISPITEIETGYDFNKTLDQNGVSYIYEYPYSIKAIGGNSLNNTYYDTNRLAIILKLTTNGTPRYYRLDLYDQATNKYLDIERSKHYKIIITDVNSEGYSTASEALQKRSTNTDINYEIIIGNNKTLTNGKICVELKDYYDEILIRDPSITKIDIGQIKYSLPNDMSTDSTKYKITYSGLPGSVTTSVDSLSKEFQTITLEFREYRYFETIQISYAITIEDFVYNGSLAISRKAAIDCHTIAFNLGDSILKFSNTTPIDWQKLKNEEYISCDKTDRKAIPIFQDKTINESQITSSGKRIKYIVKSKAPRYIGRDSSSSDNHMIMEAIEEDRNLSLNSAIAYCNSKNDVNSNGIIDDNETRLWRVPKVTQLNGINSSYNPISVLVSGAFWFNNNPGGLKYALCTSANTSIRDTDLGPDDMPLFIKVRCIRDL